MIVCAGCVMIKKIYSCNARFDARRFVPAAELWDILDEHGDIDQGHYRDMSVLCNHTFAAILGKGFEQVTRIDEKL